MHQFSSAFDLPTAWLLAQQAEPTTGLGLLPLMPLLVIFLLYIFMIQRPQRREQAKREEMLRNIKKNDHVLTTSGIYGVVTNVHGDEVTVRVDETNNTRLRMSISAIARVLGDEPKDEAQKTANA